MSERSEKILKIVHISSMSIWFSSLLIIFALSVSISGITSSDVLNFALKITSIIDFQILTPAAIITFLTGAMYGIFTKWKVKDNLWIKIKIIITVLLILVGTFWLGPTLRQMTEDARVSGIEMLSNSEFLFDLKITTIFSLLNAIILLYAIVISTLKPGKQDE